MATMYIALDRFTLTSSWRYEGTEQYYHRLVGPETASVFKTFRASAVPAGSTIQAAILRVDNTRGPTGGTLWVGNTHDDGYTRQIDVTSLFHASQSGEFADFALEFKWKANGREWQSVSDNDKIFYSGANITATITVTYTAGSGTAYDPAAYHAAALAAERRIRPRITITYPDGSTQPVQEDLVLGYEINEGTDSGVLLGTCTSARMDLELANANGEWFLGGSMRGNRPLYGAKVALEIGLIVDGEWIYNKAGTYVVDEFQGEEHDPVMEISGYDEMGNALEKALDDQLTYPATLSDILAEIVRNAGIGVEGVLNCNRTVVIQSKPDWGNECTVRKALSFVCAAGGSFARITRAGVIGIMDAWKTTPEIELTPDEYFENRYDERIFTFNRIAVTPRGAQQGDAKVYGYVSSAIEELPSNTLYIDDNPLFVKGAANLQTLISGLVTALTGAVWDNMVIRWRGNPAIEIGTRVTCMDTRGQVKHSTIMGQKMAWDEGFSSTIKCVIDTHEIVRSGTTTGGGMINTKRIAVESIGGAAIASQAIDTRHLKADAVEADQIKAGAVTTEKLNAGAVTAEKIQAGAVDTEQLHAGAVTAGKIDSGAVTTGKLAAGAVTADKIGAGEVTAAKLSTDVMDAVDAEIESADISYAQIKDASVQNLITKDAVADRYFIQKLFVQNLQVLSQTVDNLVVKAANGNYYRLDITDAGAVTPTQVTVTTGEINAGVTSAGRSIIETDLLVTDLAASNIKGANALIDKITAARLDVGELFARQATINRLNAVDISGNNSLQVQAQNQINLTVGQLNISGTNLLTDGDKTVTNSDASIVNWYLLDELVPGQDYTFTVCLTPAAEAPYYRFFTNGNYRSEGRLVPSGTGQQVISLPFTFSGYIEGQRKYQVRLYREWEPTITNPTTVHWAKLEKGAKILPIGTSKIVSDTYSPPPMGSENLLYSSNDALDIPAGTTSASRYFPTKNGEQVFWRADDMTPGETYTFTACITPGSDMTGFTLRTCYGNQINFGGLNFTGTDGRQIVSKTFVFPSTGYTNADHRLLGLRSPSSVTNAGTVHWAKLHRGVAREVWSPNPNEINNSSIKITNQGIDILTDGTLNMSGGVEGSFLLPNGTITGLNGNFTNLSIGGQKIGAGSFLMPVLCKFTQGQSSAPSGHGFLWFNASGTSYSSASRSGTTDVGYLPRTYTLGAPSNTLTSGTFTYTLTFGVVNRQNSNPDSISFKVTATINGVTFTSDTITLRKWQTQAVSIQVTSSTNLFANNNTLSVAFSSNWSGSAGLGPDLDGSGMTLTAQKSGTSGTQDVTIKYVP